ncbi:MAG: DNA polymerase III [Isosphaeraceae bacterium]|jgi:DNA processing protein|nr:MAG: DNA polymerase III [Isosphaeraceae bacterium]
MTEGDGAGSVELRELLRLTLVPGLGPATIATLLEHGGSAARVTRMGERELREIPGIGPRLAGKIAAARTEVDPDLELELCRARGVWLLTREMDAYPPRLREIVDPPVMLYVRGTLEPRDELAVAMVGSRRCSAYGARVAERLAASLARAGVTVVSGLARGIDAAAHRGALQAGGRTIAVAANGLDRTYPPEHERLAQEIADSGAVLSEMAMRQPPLASLFPQRNRIISGLSLGVVVVESAPRSGSLLTAQHAIEQNREVFAVPGPIDSLLSRGCHALIRDGAKLVETVDDILEELDATLRARLAGERVASEGAGPPPPTAPVLNEMERRLLDQLNATPRGADELIAATGLAASQVMATLSVLEMRRLAKRVPGNLFVRV